MKKKQISESKIYGKVKKTYEQKSVTKRIEALFLDNLGKILTREQIIQAATNTNLAASQKIGINGYPNCEQIMDIQFFHGAIEVT